MTELHLRGEHLGTSTDGPGNDGLLDDTLLDSLDDSVLFSTTNFTQEKEHLALGVGLVSEKVVDEGSAGVSVTTDGNTLVDAVGGVREDVVELVGHTTRLGDVANGTRSVKLASNEVVHHTTSVTNPEASRLDTTDGSRADDDDLLLEGKVEELTSVPLRNTLGNDTDGLDLREREDLEGRSVDGSGRCEVDNDVNVRVLLDGLTDGSVDGKESFLGTPVELLNVVATEGVDHSGDGRNLSTTREVKVEHALDGTGLETEDERPSVIVERSEPRSSARDGLSVEPDDLVVGLLPAAVSLDSTNVVGHVGNARGSTVRGSDGGRGDRSNVTGDGGRRSLNTESHGDDGSDRRLGAVDFHEDTKRFTAETHSLETLLIVRTSTSHPDLDVVSNETLLVLLKGSDDTLESGSNVGEVGSTTTDDEDLTFGVRSASGHKVDDGLSVLVGLTFRRGTRVFTVVGELMGETSSGNGVGVDNGGTTTGNHGPDSTLRIKDSELERSTGRGVELLDVSLFLGQVTTERSGPDHGGPTVGLDASGTGSSGRDVTSNSPHRTTEEISSLIKLGSHVEILNLGRLAVNSIEADKRVDLEIGDLGIVSCVLECIKKLCTHSASQRRHRRA